MARSGIPFVLKVKGSNHWHFRRDVPAEIREKVGITRWSFRLRGTTKRELEEEARQLAAQTDRVIAFHKRKDPLGARPLYRDAAAI